MAETKKSFEQRAAAEPTELHKNFAEWLYVQTGIKPDLKTVQLVCSMRMDFQKSEENQKHLAQRKAEAAAAKKRSAALKKAKLEAQLAKLKADLDKVDAPASAPVVPASKPAVETPAEKPVRKRAVRRPSTKAVKNPPAPVADDFDADDLTDANAAKPVRRTRRPAAKKTTAPVAKA